LSGKKRQEIIIGKDGNVRAVYSPETDSILKQLGATETRRASHVEPTPELSDSARRHVWENYEGEIEGTMTETAEAVLPEDKWWADMLPVGGPVLGPFDNREQALDAETQWLSDNNVPNCRNGECGINQPDTQPAANSDRECDDDDDVICRTQIEPPTSKVLSEDEL